MNRKKNRRRGATVLELSIVLVVFLIVTFGTLDLGICVFRYNMLNNAARQGARRAVVHGALASVEGTWSSTATPLNVQTVLTGGSTTGTNALVNGTYDSILGMLVGCNLSNTTINVNYSNNTVGSNVTVTVTTNYTPFMWFLGTSTRTITASSTMQITH